MRKKIECIIKKEGLRTSLGIAAGTVLMLAAVIGMAVSWMDARTVPYNDASFKYAKAARVASADIGDDGAELNEGICIMAPVGGCAEEVPQIFVVNETEKQEAPTLPAIHPEFMMS